jgi:hypothetical protein
MPGTPVPVPPPEVQHSTSDGPGQSPATKVPEHVFEVGSQTPLPLDVVHVATQHSISAAPGQYPDIYVPPVQALDVDEQNPGPLGVVQEVVARFWMRECAEERAMQVVRLMMKFEKCIMKYLKR